METVLGLFGLIIFVVGVTSLAAGVTWLVTRLFPQKKQEPKAEPQES